MVAKKIESLQHPLVKHAVKLREEASYRKESKEVLVIGKKMAEELPLHILFSETPSKIPANHSYLVSKEILCKITGMKSSDGFAGITLLPAPQDLQNTNHLLILDEIADPGNLGTLVRTALALGWEGIVLTPNTVDLFNDKTVRASKGAVFKMPYAKHTPSELIQWKHRFFTADLEGEILDQATFSSPIALILSNEGKGPGTWSEKRASKITIPMSDAIESLNVASSGAILLYAMRPR